MMSTLLLTPTDETGCVTPRRVRARDRLRARLGAWQLDLALAAGACPDASAVLSLRAGRLISRRTRRRVAQEIRRVLREAERPRSPLDRSVAPVAWVVAEAGLLEHLADHLLSTEPVNALGVARLRVLMRDGSGPLYTAPDWQSLRWPLMSAIDGLEPWPDGDRLCEDAGPDERGRWD